MMFGYGYGNGFGCFSSIWGMGLFLLITVVVIYLIAKKLRPSSTTESRQLLDIKYASGDLTKEEYEEKKRVLK